MHVYVSDTVIYTDHDDVVYIYIYVWISYVWITHITYTVFFWELGCLLLQGQACNLLRSFETHGDVQTSNTSTLTNLTARKIISGTWNHPKSHGQWWTPNSLRIKEADVLRAEKIHLRSSWTDLFKRDKDRNEMSWIWEKIEGSTLWEIWLVWDLDWSPSRVQGKCVYYFYGEQRKWSKRDPQANIKG